MHDRVDAEGERGHAPEEAVRGMYARREVWIESVIEIWEVAYTSQGERPFVDLMRQLLMSCGMSCTVHKIAPVAVSE